jgi:hypothetical protein
VRILADLHSAPLSLVLVFVLGVAAIAVAFLPIPWPRISRAVGAFLWIGAAELLCVYFLPSFWFYRVALLVGVLLWLAYTYCCSGVVVPKASLLRFLRRPRQGLVEAS